MKELVEILLGLAAFVGLVWLYTKFLEVYERTSLIPPKFLVMRWLTWRNQLITILGKNDHDVLL